MKRVFVSSLLLFTFLLSLEQKVLAYSSDPEKFISEIVDEAKVILNSSETQEIKAKKLTDIALNTVDIKGLAYYTLGKKRKQSHLKS